MRRAGWLGAGLLLFATAVLAHIAQAVIHPQWYWQQTDASVYRAAGAAILGQHGMLYSLRLGSPGLSFTYPPFAALLFASVSPFPFVSWKFALAAASILVLPVIAYVSLGLAGRRPGAGRLAGAFALAAAGLWLEPVQKTLLFGQLSLLLLALVMADLAGPDTRRWKGMGIGIAAGIKLTPLIFIPYLYVTGRRRAALTATVTFAATVALGFILLPGDSVAYWGGGFIKPGDGPERLVNQSINGVVQRAMHGGTAALAVWLALAALAFVAGLATAAAASRHGRELLAIVVCGVTGLLVSPISWTHHWVYVIPGLALAAVGSPASVGRLPASGRRPESPPGVAAHVPRHRLAWAARLAAGAVVLGLFGMWPARSGPNGYYDPGAAFVPRGLLRFAPHNFGREYHWHGLELIVGNYYVLAGIVFVVAAAAYVAVKSAQPRSAGPARPILVILESCQGLSRKSLCDHKAAIGGSRAETLRPHRSSSASLTCG
jgi:alpha-1,2-mannosyltransferase